MEIIEEFIRGKKNNTALNEDKILVTPDFIALFDGVTSKAGLTLGGYSIGRYAVEVLAAELSRLPPGIEGLPAVRRLALHLQEKTKADSAAEGVDIPDIASHPAACMIVYSKARREIWRVGDSGFMVDGVANMKDLKIEEVWKPLRHAFIHAEFARGKTENDILKEDGSWKLLMPLIGDFKIFANHAGPYGYSVFNGKPVAENHVEIYDVSQAHEIVLASDGYLKLFPTLAETEDYLDKMLAEDPLLYKTHPQVKGLVEGQISYDDRSYIRFRP